MTSGYAETNCCDGDDSGFEEDDPYAGEDIDPGFGEINSYYDNCDTEFGIIHESPKFFKNMSNQIIHIRVFKRNANKYITIIENLSASNIETLLKQFKKNFNCNGSISNKVIHLQGDQRIKVKEYLITNKITDKDNISVHGF